MSELAKLGVFLTGFFLVGSTFGNPITPSNDTSSGIQWNFSADDLAHLQTIQARATWNNATVPDFYKLDNNTMEWCSTPGPPIDIHNFQTLCNDRNMKLHWQIERVKPEPGTKECTCREWKAGKGRKAIFRLCNCDICDSHREFNVQEICKRLMTQCIDYEEAAGFVMPADPVHSWYAMLYTEGTPKQERAARKTLGYQYLKQQVNNTCDVTLEGAANPTFSGDPVCDHPGFWTDLYHTLFTDKCLRKDQNSHVEKMEL